MTQPWNVTRLWSVETAQICFKNQVTNKFLIHNIVAISTSSCWHYTQNSTIVEFSGITSKNIRSADLQNIHNALHTCPTWIKIIDPFDIMMLQPKYTMSYLSKRQEVTTLMQLLSYAGCCFGLYWQKMTMDMLILSVYRWASEHLNLIHTHYCLFSNCFCVCLALPKSW